MSGYLEENAEICETFPEKNTDLNPTIESKYFLAD